MTKPPSALSLPPLSDPRRRLLLKAGVGLLGLPLINACGSSEPVAATGTPPPPVPPPTAVETAVRGIHVSYTEDIASGRSVTWFTDGLEDPGSVLEWGPVEPGMSATDLATLPLPNRVEGAATQAFGIEVLTHRADIAAAPADRAIRYRVGSEGDFSSVRVLQPTPSDGFRFIHFGDSGVNAAGARVMTESLARAPDFVLIAGDLSYANGDQAIWDQWFDQLDPLASQIPVMYSPGNHEAKDGGGAGYTSRLSLPGAENYYSFDVQRVHFCVSTAGCLLTEEDPASAAALAQELFWIETDLAQAAARRAAGEIDFIVFVQHYTIWTNEDGRDPANPSLVALEEGILLRYGVDLLLVGHDHIYERSKPMAYGLPVPTGYVQVTQGGGGQSLYEVLASPASWSAIAVVRHGCTVFQVAAGSITAQSWAVSDETGTLLPTAELIDEFSLTPRGLLPSAAFAQPARSAAELLARWPEVVAHTRRRNALHDLGERMLGA